MTDREPRDVPDGSVYVMHRGQLHLLGVWDECSSIHVERGIRPGPDAGGFMTYEPGDRICMQVELSVPMPSESPEPTMEANDYHGA